jgi:hypothetical protein
MRAKRSAESDARKQDSMTRLMKDMAVADKKKPQPGDKLPSRGVKQEFNEDENDDEDDEGEVLDRNDMHFLGGSKPKQEPGVYDDGAKLHNLFAGV